MAEVENLRGFSFFKSIRTNQIDKILQSMVKKQYSHNQMVFEQGSSVTKGGAYFINSGEFEVT